jgi:hypothetical protein
MYVEEPEIPVDVTFKVYLLDAPGFDRFPWQMKEK